MPGGLLQLNAYGSQNQYLNGNPQMTFFKVVYRRYTNFSFEYIRQDITGPNELSENVPIQLSCKIDRNGDLIQQIYFVIELPDIYSGYDQNNLKEIIINKKNLDLSLYKFRWVKNLGTTMINWVQISIGGQQIDKQYGEWMQIWSELNLTEGSISSYNKLIGNTTDIYDPESVLGNNGLYPSSSLINLDIDSPIKKNTFVQNLDPLNIIFDDNDDFLYSRPPSIKGRKLMIPLNFWFCQNPGLSLPLIALQYHDVFLKIELRPLTDLYTIIETDPNSSRFGTRVKPNSLRSEQNINNFITERKNWLEEDLNNEETILRNQPFRGWGLNPYFLINYFFLDKEERRRFAKTTHEYLITQTYLSQHLGVIGSKSLELKLHHPVKQLIWTTKRSDVSSRNDWTNYSNWTNEDLDPFTVSYLALIKENNNNLETNSLEIPNKSNMQYYQNQILKKARLLFNGEERIRYQDFEFFNYLQPYEYSIRSPKTGIYVYSFSIEKDLFQPSGSCNMSRINRIQLEIECVPTPRRISDNETLQYLYGFNVDVYAVNYNVLRIMAGMAGLVFSN